MKENKMENTILGKIIKGFLERRITSIDIIHYNNSDSYDLQFTIDGESEKIDITKEEAGYIRDTYNPPRWEF